MGQDYCQTYARTRVERRIFFVAFFAPNTQGVLQGVAFMGVEVFRGKGSFRCIKKRVRRTRKMK